LETYKNEFENVMKKIPYFVGLCYNENREGEYL